MGELTRGEIDRANAQRSLDAAGINPLPRASPVASPLQGPGEVSLTPSQIIAARVLFEREVEPAPGVKPGARCSEFLYVVLPVMVAALTMIVLGYAWGDPTMVEHGSELLLASVVAYPAGRSIVKAFASSRTQGPSE